MVMAPTAHLLKPRAPWRWAWLGAAIGLLLGCLVFAPAQWLAAVVFGASGQRVQLAGAQGTVWSGSSQLLLSGGPGSEQAVALPGRLHWQIRPAWTGLRVSLTTDCCTEQPLEVQALATGWSAARLELSNGKSEWPAGLLVGLGTPWNTVQAQGQLVVSTHNLSVQWARGQAQMSGQVQVDALHFSSRLSTLSPMGSYRLTVQGGSEPAINLSTLEGSLQLSGQGQWVGQRLRFRGTASAEPDRVDALSNLLNIVGRRDGARSIITVG